MIYQIAKNYLVDQHKAALNITSGSFIIYYTFTLAQIQQTRQNPSMHIDINITQQVLNLWQDTTLVASFTVSTGKKGVGEQKNSEQTPRGKHYIRAKIGGNMPLGTAFKGRRPTSENCMDYTKDSAPDRDWITTRIMWLSGREIGKNRLGNVDTFQRYIYIHGTPDWEPMGVPMSHGCIRMRNTAIAQLFELVPPFTPVTITE